MHKKTYKGRCTKISVAKSKTICKLYSDVAINYCYVLDASPEIASFKCNEPFTVNDEHYMSDFFVVKVNGNICIRECVDIKQLYNNKVVTVLKNLELSRRYWLSKGITDWGIVTNESS